MGVSRSPAELAGKILQARKALEQSQVDAIKKAAQVAKKSVESELHRVVGSDQRMSNVGRSGARLSVISRVSGSEATITAGGPWPLIESDIGRHAIGAKSRLVARQGPVLSGSRSLGRGRQQGRALRFPDGNIRRAVIHPGTKGKHPFRKGVAKSERPVIEAMRQTSVDALTSVFS